MAAATDPDPHAIRQHPTSCAPTLMAMACESTKISAFLQSAKVVLVIGGNDRTSHPKREAVQHNATLAWRGDYNDDRSFHEVRAHLRFSSPKKWQIYAVEGLIERGQAALTCERQH